MRPSFIHKEQRRWTRLQLAIPVFVRAQNGEGKETVELATAVNVSAGGALVAVRGSLNGAGWVSLEIPSPPLEPAPQLFASSRTMRAKTVWIKHLDQYHLFGFKFKQPLTTDDSGAAHPPARKSPSAV